MDSPAAMIAVDTNILVYAHRGAVPEHRRARRALEAAAADTRGWGISVGTLCEFWSVVTHPAAAGRPSPPDVALAFIDALVTGGDMQLWVPRVGFGMRLARLGLDLGVRGVRIFDLQIALVAIEQGAQELWTHDEAFVRIPGLRLHDPLLHSA
jgi:hypothetical protein